MPRHTEQFHIDRIYEDHLKPLLNDHHAMVGFFYHDRRLRKYVVQAGPRTKSRLEFLLENDADLKKAIKRDDDESNRYNDSDFVESDINKVRGRVPIARLTQKVDVLALSELSNYLKTEIFNDHVAAAAEAGKKSKKRIRYGKKEFEAWWWKHVAHLLPWHLVSGSFESLSRRKFQAIKGRDCNSLGLTNMTECLKEIIRIFLRVNNIDPDSHVVRPDKKSLKSLNNKRRARGKKFIRAISSSSGSSTSGSSTSGSSTSGSSGSGSSSSSISSYFQSQPTRPLTGRSRNQIRASVQQLISQRPLQPSTSQPPLPPAAQHPLPPASQPPLPPTSPSSQPPLPPTSPSSQPPLPPTSPSSQPSPILSESALHADLPLITLESDSSLSDTIPVSPRQAHPSSPLNLFNRTRSKEAISNQEFRLLLDAGNKKKKRKT